MRSESLWSRQFRFSTSITPVQSTKFAFEESMPFTGYSSSVYSRLLQHYQALLQLLTGIALSHLEPPGRVCRFDLVSMGPKKTPLHDALQPLWDKIWNLEGAIGDVHPQYAKRTVKRMEELAELTRQHANDVLRIANQQKVALSTTVHESKQCQVSLEETASKCQASLEEATNRHYKEAHELRFELYGLKMLIGEQSNQYRQERQQNLDAICEARQQSMAAMQGQRVDFDALKVDFESVKVDLEALKNDMEGQRGEYMEILRVGEELKQHHEIFESRQKQLMQRSLQTPPEEMHGIMVKAKRMAGDRSPSSRSISRDRSNHWKADHGGHSVSWSHGASRASSRPPVMACIVQADPGVSMPANQQLQ